MTTPTPEPTNETVEKKIKGAIEKVLIDLLTDKKGFDHLSTALEDLTQAENDLFDLFSEERKRAQKQVLQKLYNDYIKNFDTVFYEGGEPILNSNYIMDYYALSLGLTIKE